MKLLHPFAMTWESRIVRGPIRERGSGGEVARGIGVIFGQSPIEHRDHETTIQQSRRTWRSVSKGLRGWTKNIIGPSVHLGVRRIHQLGSTFQVGPVYEKRESSNRLTAITYAIQRLLLGSKSSNAGSAFNHARSASGSSHVSKINRRWV